MRPELPQRGIKDWHNLLDKWHKVLRGNISYGNMTVGDIGRNIDGYPTAAVSAGVINTDFPVAHGLNRVPVGYHVVRAGAAVKIYDGVTAWTKTTLYLRADTINVHFTVFIF